MFLFFPVMMQAQTLPNIVFIFADDLGHGEIGFNSSIYETATPTIDSLCRNAAYFSNFYARPVCSPSRYELMTGKHPFRRAGNWDYSVNYPFTSPPNGINPDSEKTLPEHLKEYGYQTAHFGKWHLGAALPEHSPKSNGFDFSFGTNSVFHSMKAYTWRDIHNFTRNNDKYTPDGSGEIETDYTSDTLLSWITRQAADTTAPFFVYYAFTNPHDDSSTDTIPYIQSIYDVAPAGTTDFKQKWASIKDMDNRIAEIWELIRSLGVEDNTIIIFTSDNGGDSSNAPDNSPFTGAKTQLYEGGVRVPFAWYQSGVVDSMTVDSVTCLADILPTFVEGICGGTVLDTIDGVNFHPLLGGSGSFPAERVWYGPYLPGRCWSVRKGQWKLVNNVSASVTSSGALSDNIKLFDLENDETESTDVSGSNAAKVSELQALIDAITPESMRTITTTPGSGWDFVRWYGDVWSMYESSYQHTVTDYKR